MDIEEYSIIAPQYYNDNISSLLRKYLDCSNYNNILDCGCGDGSLLHALNKLNYLNNKKIFAIDLSKNRIKMVKEINPNIVAVIDNAEKLISIKNNSIDFFISTQVIEHVDDKRMIKQIKKKVRNGGIVYISTVFKKWYGWYFYRNKNKWVLDPTHIREYSSDKQLLNLFGKNKFKLLEQRKRLQWFPICDFFIKRIALKNRKLYEHIIMKIVRKIKLPILGYYNWELVFRKI